MEKEKVLEIEFKQVWDKWAWRIVKNKIPVNKVEFNKIKISVIYKNNLFFFDSYENEYKMIEETELIFKNDKLELEEFVAFVNEKYGIKKRWRAEQFEDYYYINFDYFEIYESDECFEVSDNDRYKCGNYFKTKKEAETYLEKIKKILLERE